MMGKLDLTFPCVTRCFDSFLMTFMYAAFRKFERFGNRYNRGSDASLTLKLNRMWRTVWDDERTLREKVAKGNRQAEEDCARLRPDRGAEMGQALLHLPEKERGDRHPAKGRVRAFILQRHLAKGSEAHPPKDRRAHAGGPLD